MNKTIIKALEINKEADFNTNLPFLEEGDELFLKDLLEGDECVRDILDVESKSYKISDYDWVNYEFEVLREDEEDPMDTVIRITNICLI